MGITGLLTLLKSIHKPCTLKSFAGQTLGIDAYVWLHRGVIPCAIDLALGKPTTRYIDYFLNRVRMCLHFGVVPYIVFDGDFLPSKAITEKERATRRSQSKDKGLELLRLGQISQAQSELQRAVDVTPEMAKSLIEELKRMQIKYIVAPFEADSQLAYLEKRGIIDGIVSEDSDLLVFGAKSLITKLDNYGNGVQICRDDFTACREVNLVGWSDTDFRRMAILSGCDYLPGIRSVGLKTAHRYLRKYKTVERVIRAIQFDGQFQVPADYLEKFRIAEQTFLHQWVFCPSAQDMVHLTEPDQLQDAEDLHFIGRKLDSAMANSIAKGDLNPQSKECFSDVVKCTDSIVEGQSIFKSHDSRSKGTHQSQKTTIQSFFKSKRTPLIELDLNTIRHSPPRPCQSQNSRSDSQTSDRYVAARVSEHSSGEAARTASGLAPGRNKVSYSENPEELTERPLKRKRQFLDDSPDDLTGLRVEPGRSKFFAKVAMNAPAEIKIWSDASDVEAAEPLACANSNRQQSASSYEQISSQVCADPLRVGKEMKYLNPSNALSPKISLPPEPSIRGEAVASKTPKYQGNTAKGNTAKYLIGSWSDTRGTLRRSGEVRARDPKSCLHWSSPLHEANLNATTRPSRSHSHKSPPHLTLVPSNISPVRLPLPPLAPSREIITSTARVLVEVSPQRKTSPAAASPGRPEGAFRPGGSEDFIISESEDEAIALELAATPRKYPDFKAFLYHGT